MIISVDDIIPDVISIILRHPTGVFYSAQAGGMMCDHPKYEGVLFPFDYTVLENFDDCSYGCDHLHDIEGAALKLANDLNEIFRKLPPQINVRFDFNRITELQEGWWPVIFTGKIGWFQTNEFNEIEGIIISGNCD